jgi:hypothetical protein
VIVVAEVPLSQSRRQPRPETASLSPLKPWKGAKAPTPSQSGLRLMEVKVAAAPGGSALRLLVEGLSIEVPDGFTAETLAKVIAVVRSC